jgi:hypothetical protein
MGRLLGLAAIAALLLSGCGGGDDNNGGATASTPTPTPTATPSATPSETATAAPTVEGAPVAEGQGSADGGRFVFRITELRRSGPTVVLNATVSLAGGSEKDEIQLNDTFSDGVFVNIKNSDAQEQGDVFDGVALIDPNARKKYLVARQADGRCVCSNELGGEFVEEDAPVNLQATLAAPPESVTKVNVVVPSVKTFIDVPLS